MADANPPPQTDPPPAAPAPVLATKRLSTWQSIGEMFVNARIRSVALQSFASGLPLGLIWIAMPAWLKYREVDIKTMLRGGAPDDAIAQVVRQNVAVKWEGHEINTARFIKPLRTMHAIGG